MIRFLRAVVWAVALGVLESLGAAALSRLLPIPVAVLLAALLVALGMTLVIDLTRAIAVAAGACEALIIGAVMALSIAAFEPDATWRALFWRPLFVWLAALLACAIASLAGSLLARRLLRGRKA